MTCTISPYNQAHTTFSSIRLLFQLRQGTFLDTLNLDLLYGVSSHVTNHWI